MVEHQIQNITFQTKLDIKDYNVKIDGKKAFDQPINNDNRTWKY